MVSSVASEQHDQMLQALAATKIAIHHYAEACRLLRRQPHPSVASHHLELNIRRLEAMEADLHRRTRPGATADANYVSLTVLHAGLLSLADASGRLHDSYRRTLAIDPPAEGWFSEEGVEGASAEALGPGATEPAGQSEA